MIFFELILKNCLSPFLTLICIIMLSKAETPEKEKNDHWNNH